MTNLIIPQWLVWRLYGGSVESDTFMEILWKMSLEIIWDCHGENQMNQITKQSPYYFYHKISIKS